MKKKMKQSKLTLKRSTISNLDRSAMKEQRGGGATELCTVDPVVCPDTFWYCQWSITPCEELTQLFCG